MDLTFVDKNVLLKLCENPFPVNKIIITDNCCWKHQRVLMGKEETTKIFAYVGLILIIVSIIIGAWVSVENRNTVDKNVDDPDYMDSENRTAFFYSRNIGVGFTDMDKLYFINPAPGHSGFNFFLLMTGITFIIYAFYISISSGESLAKNLAMLGLIIMVISLILSAWVSYTNYSITREQYEAEPDYEEINDKFESIILVQYLNAALVFFGPALILFSVFRERVKNPEAIHNYLVIAGFIILILSLVFAIIAGNYSKKMAGAGIGNLDDIGGWMKNRAIISQLFPYLTYLGIGLIMFPIAHDHTKRKFTASMPAYLTLIGLICVILGVLLTVYPAVQYHKVATEFDDYIDNMDDGSDKFDEAMDDYYKSTAFCYFGTLIAFLGIGLMLFAMLYGNYAESGDFSSAQILNLMFMILLFIGMIMGIYAGILKNDLGEDDGPAFFSVEYLYMVFMFSGTGLMMFNWTRNAELFSNVKSLCPDCGEEVQYYSQYNSFYCDTCEELVDEPIEHEIKYCPDCNTELDFIVESRRLWCGFCEDYKRIRRPVPKRRKGGRPATRRRGGRPAVHGGAGGPAARRRGGRPAAMPRVPTHAHHAGAPPSGRKPKCRNCMQFMTFIQQYDRWYCHSCKRYGGAPGSTGIGASSGERRKKEPSKRTITGPGKSDQWEVFRCPRCGKTGEIKTNKRPLNINCSQCGMMSVLE